MAIVPVPALQVPARDQAAGANPIRLVKRVPHETISQRKSGQTLSRRFDSLSLCAFHLRHG